MNYEIIPAIDLMNGKVVRLEQGRKDRATIYSENPAAMAHKWEEAGAKRLHVVDLDGAFDGEPRNLDAVRAICQAVEMEVELGGGLRTNDHVQAALDAGVQRVILGTRAFEDECFLQSQAQILGPQLIVGVDARGGRVALRGWVDNSDVWAWDFLRRLEQIGVREVIFTDIATDGMMTGPNLRSLAQAAQSAPSIQFIASGGVSSLEDILEIARLRIPNVIGAICGKALYTGAIQLGKAIRVLSMEGFS